MTQSKQSIPALIITEPGVGYSMEIAEIVELPKQGILRLSGQAE